MVALSHLLFAALSLADWQASATDAAMRAAGFDAIEREARPGTLRWGLLLPNVSVSWAARDLSRVPIDESNRQAYASRGESWQLHASWELSRLVQSDISLPWGHWQLQLYEHRRQLRSEVARELARACDGGLEAQAGRMQLTALTGGWSARYPPPGACAGQQVPK